VDFSIGRTGKLTWVFPISNQDFGTNVDRVAVSCNYRVCSVFGTWDCLRRNVTVLRRYYGSRGLSTNLSNTVHMTFRESIHISEKAHYASLQKTSLLMLFGRTIAAYYRIVGNIHMQCVGNAQEF
jgi:hypothetical protein